MKNFFKILTSLSVLLVVSMICVPQAMAQYYPTMEQYYPRSEGISEPVLSYEKNSVSRDLNGKGFVDFNRLNNKSKMTGHYIDNMYKRLSSNFYLTPGGYSLEGTYEITNKLNFSFGYEKTALSLAGTFAEYDSFSLSMNAPAVFAVLKLKPRIYSSFYYSAGLYFGGYRIQGSAVLDGLYKISNKTFYFNKSELTLLNESQRSIQPFFGLGYDKTLLKFSEESSPNHLKFSVLAGIRYAGVGDVALNSNDNDLINDPVFLAELRTKANSIKQQYSIMGVAPVFRIGIGYNF